MQDTYRLTNNLCDQRVTKTGDKTGVKSVRKIDKRKIFRK
jgi:hypothetical protein